MTHEHTSHHEMEATQSPPAKTSHRYIPPKRAERRGLHRKEGWGSVASTIAVLMIAPLIALLLTAFVFQSYQVDGPSMETTLQDNDRLLVWKVSKTWSKITGNAYTPNRGDVIVFVEEDVSGFSQDPGKQLIKRVIALPGERVVVKNNKVTVYNDEHPRGFEPDHDLPYGNVIGQTSGDIDAVISKDHVFVLGDNRSNSLDSRAFGEVESKNIVGKLVMRVWPANKLKAF